MSTQKIGISVVLMILIATFFTYFIFETVLEQENTIHVKHEEQEGERAYVFAKSRNEGLALPEIDYLSEEEIIRISKILVNPVGTKQSEMDEALTLLNRMKKSDYEKTWLLYLEGKVKDAKSYGDEHAESVASSIKRRIVLYQTIFELCEDYDVSFLRLDKDTKADIRAAAKKRAFLKMFLW